MTAAAGSSATSTTARSSGSSRSGLSCGLPSRSCPKTLTEHHVIRKHPELLGRYLDALEAEEQSENLPRMLLSRVVLVGQHGSEHVPLELLQFQVMPLVARRVSSAGEAEVIAQREAASVGKVSELMHVE